MAVYYVFQGETYKEERDGGYVWSPQRTASGHKNAGYTMMTKIRKGDVIIHNANSKILSISITENDYYEAKQPYELSIAKTSSNWNNEGFRVDTRYIDLDTPITVTNYKTWLAEHYIEDSAFTKKGTGKQQYMCHLADEHAIFLLKEAINLQTQKHTLNELNAALEEIKMITNKESEYDQVEIEDIHEILEESSNTIPSWGGNKEPQTMVTSSKTKRLIPKRDPRVAADALIKAGFKCEFDNNHMTFIRKNSNKHYTEPHHLIPISKYRDFEFSVDVMENIVSLCSHCHNLLHYGRFEDKKPILKALLTPERKLALSERGLNLTEEKLESYYK